MQEKQGMGEYVVVEIVRKKDNKDAEKNEFIDDKEHGNQKSEK